MQTVIGGVILLAFGLIAGVMIGFLLLGDPSATTAGDATNGEKAGVANLLRGRSKQMAERVVDAEAKVVGAIKDKAHRLRMQARAVKVPHLDFHRHANDKQAGTHPFDAKSLGTSREDYMDHVAVIGGSGQTPYIGEAAPESFDFSNFSPQGGHRYPEYRFGDSPFTYGDSDSDEVARSRRFFVKRAMEHAWGSYKKYAFGMDEVLPVTMSGSNGWGGQSTTLLDSLDTLWLMNMKTEFYEARDFVRDKLSFQVTRLESVFETTIRSLGGLLAAYDWSGDTAFLDKAKDLGSRLFNAFDTPSGLPRSQIKLATGQASMTGWLAGTMLTAEVGTLQIEFRMLGKVTGKSEYATKSEHVFDALRAMNPENGLYPYSIRESGGQLTFANQKLTFGAMSDSYYEYMLKMWLQGGKTESKYREMYDHAMQGMHDELVQVSSPSGFVFLADKNNGKLDTKMDHLACFMGGLLALGAYTDPTGLDSARAQRDLKTAKALTYTCYQTYAQMGTGIAPEFVQFVAGQDFVVGRGAPHYLLRPETVESFFVLYHLTKDPVYREWGWEVFQAIERYCRADGGYGSLHNVQDTTKGPDNKMESFFLAETLKYLYLLFDPDTEIDLLNKHVFNTEAHPMRILPLVSS